MASLENIHTHAQACVPASALHACYRGRTVSVEDGSALSGAGPGQPNAAAGILLYILHRLEACRAPLPPSRPGNRIKHC